MLIDRNQVVAQIRVYTLQLGLLDEAIRISREIAIELEKIHGKNEHTGYMCGHADNLLVARAAAELAINTLNEMLKSSAEEPRIELVDGVDPYNSRWRFNG